MNLKINHMKKIFIGLFLIIAGSTLSQAQADSTNPIPKTVTKEERKVLELSKAKWQWMADKDVDKLEPLFDNRAKFVHMSGTWKKEEELDIIKTGKIWYKNAKVHDTAIELSGKTAIVWNRITLTAVVRGTDVVTEFTVTEVYQKQRKDWKMLALTFSSVRDTHQIKK
jgi:hypothetical protein